MKNHMGLILLAISLSLVSFSNFFTIDDVATAMRSGNISRLSVYLDSRVDISMPDRSDSYSKSQAEMVIGDFFNSNEVRNFRIRHKGENSGSEYCVGVLETKNGDYQTTFFMRQKGDRQLLEELRFQSIQ
ncbi:MAG TPA: DUF4783 domain-containing protein [Puia sp.]|nr:DUF4783 domain-containing protein [Puia sp.]